MAVFVPISGIGNVVGGSLFAAVQSAGAGGIYAGAATVGAKIIGGASGAAAFFFAPLITTAIAMLNFFGQALDWAKAHPRQVTAITAPLAVAVAPQLLIVPLLGPLGFTAGGVAAGSTAAGIQAGIGLVEAGSIFAFLQSAAAGGYAAGFIATTSGVVAGIAGVGAVANAAMNPNSEDDTEKDEDGNDDDDDGHDAQDASTQTHDSEEYEDEGREDSDRTDATDKDGASDDGDDDTTEIGTITPASEDDGGDKEL